MAFQKDTCNVCIGGLTAPTVKLDVLGDIKSSGTVTATNVVAVSDSGITLFSDNLIWDSKGERLHTKEEIMITTPEADTLYGVGFESDSDLKNWKIINPSGVTGRGLK